MSSANKTCKTIDWSQFQLGKEYDSKHLNLVNVKGLKFVRSETGVRFLCRFTFDGKKISQSLGSCCYEELYTKILSLATQVQAYHQTMAKGTHPFNHHTQSMSDMSFANFALKVYLPNAKSRKKSYCNDETRLRVHILPIVGDKAFSDINVAFLNLFFTHLRSDKNLSNATINRVRALLSSIFNLAIDHEVTDFNPITRIKKFREDNQRERYLNESELSRLMQVLSKPEQYNIDNHVIVAAVKFLLLTGVRKREALDLRFTDVDVETGSWLLGVNKSGKARRILLNQDALNIIETLPRRCDYVFANPQTNQPYNDIRKCFDKIMAAANIHAMRIHDLRHNFASLAVNSGESLYVVQHLLGHASPQTTQRYAHLQSQTLLDASEGVANIIRNSQLSA